VELRIFTEPQQGATYDDLLRVARTAEDAGYDAFFRSDHYLKMGGSDGLPGPTDAWTTLAGLARETSRIRLGTLMTAATFRHPGPLAITVAQVDRMSGGRVEFGFGAGWYEAEHNAYGIPFPSVGERFDRYAEQLEVITGLWAAEGAYSFEGEHYRLVDSPALPKPVQSPLPVLIGGVGAKRTPALAARFAGEFNLPFQDHRTALRQFDRVAAACADIGRDPAELTRSVALVLCVGRDDAQVAERAAKNCAPTGSRARRPRSSTGSRSGGRRPGSNASTSRCSTSPTSTRSSSWPPRWRRHWLEVGFEIPPRSGP
jgi:F420-dependent oxidoreductase-like protein